MNTRPGLKLSHEGALRALDAAISKASELGVPQNITIVDEGGNPLAFIRMDGAKLVSIDTSRTKAITAASHCVASGKLGSDAELKMSLASGGRFTSLPGGLPILFDTVCVGAIGVGSGTGAQDVEVALAALKAIGADKIE